MKCLNCNTEMVCVDDVNEIGTRMDFEECPGCRASANIIYGNGGKIVEKVEWFRNKKETIYPYIVDFFSNLMGDVYKLFDFDVRSLTSKSVQEILSLNEMAKISSLSIIPATRLKILIIIKEEKVYLFHSFRNECESYINNNPLSQVRFMKIGMNDINKMTTDYKTTKNNSRIIDEGTRLFKHLLIDLNDN